MWLSWQQAVWLAVACVVVAVGASRLVAGNPLGRLSGALHLVAAVTREVAIVASLYALWQYVFALTVTRTAGAMEHARSIYHLEQAVGLPSELTVQRWSMRSDLLIEFLNRYYAYVHVTAMGVLVVWLFFRHRDRYPRIRNVLALSTGACLAIQSIPVAPPRFLPDLGFVDTALLYGQSVYGEGGSGLSNQLAAMPSVHVVWSTLIAGAVIWASKSRWRWLVLAHPVITLWAVVATGNHWWADAIVAWVLLALSVGLLDVVARYRDGSTAESSPQGDTHGAATFGRWTGGGVVSGPGGSESGARRHGTFVTRYRHLCHSRPGSTIPTSIQEQSVPHTPDVPASIDRRVFLQRTGTGVLAGGALWAAPQVLTAPAAFAAGSNEPTWTQQSPGASGAARNSFAMATDASGNVVLFGGWGPSGYLGDTWIWSGTTWTQQSPSTSPAARFGHAMATASSGNVILYGGMNTSGFLGDTWIWG